MKMTEFDLKEYLHSRKEMIDLRLEELMKKFDISTPGYGLDESMKYSLFAGGKRLRPIILCASHELFMPLTTYALKVACSLEMLHTYSLIHDDLPCFDNDDLRRGLPTNHVRFGEWMAILAGDALNTYAFEVLASPEDSISTEIQLDVIGIIAHAAGPEGMALGQAMDMRLEKKAHKEAEIMLMETLKTGRLIIACAQLGAVLTNAGEVEKSKLMKFGQLLGRAFQIKDDLLDTEGKESELGKHPGKDNSAGKATIPAMIGIEKSRILAHELAAQAVAELESYGEKAEVLQALAHYVVNRKH